MINQKDTVDFCKINGITPYEQENEKIISYKKLIGESYEENGLHFL